MQKDLERLSVSSHHDELRDTSVEGLGSCKPNANVSDVPPKQPSMQVHRLCAQSSSDNREECGVHPDEPKLCACW